MKREEIENIARQYAWAHDTIGVNKETFDTKNVPIDKMVRVPIGEEIETAVLFGIRYALSHVQDWISVEDKLPEHKQRVCCVGADGIFRIAIFCMKREYPLLQGFSEVKGGDVPNVYRIPFVTHWMPVTVPDEAERNSVLAKYGVNMRSICADVILSKATDD